MAVESTLTCRSLSWFDLVKVPRVGDVHEGRTLQMEEVR